MRVQRQPKGERSISKIKKKVKFPAKFIFHYNYVIIDCKMFYRRRERF